MKKKENVASILIEDIDDEILVKMPEWFRILRHAFETKTNKL